MDGARVMEDKLCLFLEQQVINQESQAAGYQNRKAKRKEMWKNSDQAKRQKTAKWVGGQLGGKVVIGLAVGLVVGLAVGLIAGVVVGVAARVAAGLAAAIGEEIIKWDKEALDALFNKTIKYLIINNYVFIINKFYI